MTYFVSTFWSKYVVHNHAHLHISKKYAFFRNLQLVDDTLHANSNVNCGVQAARRKLTDFEELERLGEYYKKNPIPNLEFSMKSPGSFRQLIAERNPSADDLEKERIYRRYLYQICEVNKRKMVLTTLEYIRKNDGK